MAVGGTRLAALCQDIELGKYSEDDATEAVHRIREEFAALSAALTAQRR